MRRTSIALALSALLSLAPGCITWSSQHEALTARVTRIEGADAERQRLLLEARQQVDSLNQQLTQARAQTRNMADLGARLDGLDEQIRQLRGGIDELRRALDTGTAEQTSARAGLATQLSAMDRRVGELERRTGLAPAVAPDQVPAGNPEALAQARAALTARDFVRARALATALLTRAPQDPLADDARLLLGRSYLEEGRPANAIQELRRLVQDYPTADTLPEALTVMSEAFIRLGWCTDATRTLRLLVERHGSSPEGTAARRRLDEVRRLPRAACTQ